MVSPVAAGQTRGLVGTMKNAGKVAGPAMAGVLITWVEYGMTFVIMGLLLLAGAAAIWRHYWTANRRKRRSDAVPGHAGLYD